ncbi:taste receptor type 2 member 14-like [Octodon degus]|uniref:Taste receptor type 2 n=1 Tax=Octodon degus TaxID=10160 RepID=A0A6P3V9B0_OCTDE|nr:taste receptor type 2 member 14-like [Octodon degus]
MGSVTGNIFTIIFSVEFIIGNLGNGFIVLVNSLGLLNSRKISVAGHLLTALAISRIGFLWLISTKWYMYVFYPNFWMNLILLRTMYMIWIITCHFSMWLATCLCIFCCLKTATFSNSIFHYFKWRVKKMVSVTLLVSLVILVVNVSYSPNFHDFPEFLQLALSNTIFTLMAFTLSLTTFLTLIFSLWKYLKKVQHNFRGSRDVNTTAHIKALQTVVASFLLYTIFFLSIFIQLWRYKFPNSLYFYFCQTAEIAFPSLHSFVLILGNSKLKQAFLSVLSWLKNWSKDVEPSGA